jgi:hypothetical protein
MKKNLPTAAFSNFHEQYVRLQAFYMEVNSAPVPFRVSILRLSRELILFQLMAITEVYQKEATRLLVQHNTEYLSKYRKTLMKMLADKAVTTTWSELYDGLIDAGVDNWTSGTYINWMDNLIREKLIGTPTTSRVEWLKVDEIKATRNLLAHNRGKVNSSYSARTQEYYKLSGKIQPTNGDERVVDYQYCYDSFQCCEKVVTSIDVEIVKMIK